MSVSASEAVLAPSARGAAADILVQVEIRDAFADVLLDHALTALIQDQRDRGLLTELVYGTLRWRARLDAELRSITRRPLDKTDAYLRNLLRLSLYQLRFLDKIPAYAIVSEAVALAKAAGSASAGGFVNAVLRAALREKSELSEPKPSEANIVALAEYWSHPLWLTEKWTQTYGLPEAIALLKANNQPSPLVVRANLLKGTRQELLHFFADYGVDAAPTRWSPQGIRLNSPSLVSRLPGFSSGRFQVQGEASQLVTLLLDPKPGERVLDSCAAPGGKTTHIAELMGNTGEVRAADVSAVGLQRIAANANRLGLQSVVTLEADFALIPPAMKAVQPYDRVLVDAPCSGLGTLRAHPEIKWRRRERDIARLARLQRRILQAAAALLKSGGVLVYSTCTLSREENENIIDHFLAGHQGFVLDDPARYLPLEAAALTQSGYFLGLPHRHDTEGFFAARMRKVN
jgi:16S rRNA (cytosine967-C5)-methyltransferase